MDIRAVTGKSSFFEQISYTNVTGKMIFWNGPRRNIFYDLDGSMSSNLFDGTARSKATIFPHYVHDEIAGKCNVAANTTKWDNSLICNSDVVVRSVMMANPAPLSWFKNTQLKIMRLSSPT